jgi:hypothetical protein
MKVFCELVVTNVIDTLGRMLKWCPMQNGCIVSILTTLLKRDKVLLKGKNLVEKR